MHLIRHLASEGRRTRQRHGRGVLGQLADIVSVAVVNGLGPEDYHRASLARLGGSEQLFDYIPMEVIHALARGLSPERVPRLASKIKNKALFEERCRTGGIRVVRTIAVADENSIRMPSGQAFVGALPTRDMILKPIIGSQGQGIEMWLCAGPDHFSNAKGDLLPREDLAARACSLAAAGGSAMLIQERVENHPDLRSMAGSALSTTRIVTMINEAGVPEVVDSFYRTSVIPGGAVDNFHAEGLLFPVELPMGRLLPGMTDGPYGETRIIHHPETGELVAGKLHPGWHEMVDLALRLHRLFPELLIPGWDIGYDQHGPIAIEGNHPPGFSLNRQASFDGLVGTRAFALLALHAGRWLEENVPETSRWRARDRRFQAASATRRSPSSSASSPEKKIRSHNSTPTI